MKKINLLMMGFLCVGGSVANAQTFARGQVPQPQRSEQPSYRSLDQVLRDLEKRHSVYFMYHNDKIKSLQVQYQNRSGEAIEETLDRILKANGLEYKKHGKIYAIFPKDADANSVRELKQSLRQTQLPPAGSVPSNTESSLETRPGASTIGTGDAPKVINVRGKVTDEKNDALPGVSIVLKGTQRGTTTNAEGQYELEIPDESASGAVLVYSFVGYASQEVVVGGRTSIDVGMQVSERGLDEIVVVGYGEQRKSDVTGASSSVSAREIAKRPLVRVEQALQGTTSGVTVSSSSGQPGRGLNVRIRGANSITGSNEPLYVIDGFVGGNIESDRKSVV